MMESQEKRLKVCRVQPIVSGPPKIILTKPLCVTKGDYNVMPYNYIYTSNIKTPFPLFEVEISDLTWSGHCFTSKELEKQNKIK